MLNVSLIYDRPLLDGQRVAPKDLNSFSQTHTFSAPCCLCPLFQGDNDRQYKHASILLSTNFAEAYGGQYIARCATLHCDYLGQRFSKLFTREPEDTHLGRSTPANHLQKPRRPSQSLHSTR